MQPPYLLRRPLLGPTNQFFLAVSFATSLFALLKAPRLEATAFKVPLYVSWR